MKRTFLLTFLLVMGLVISQVAPGYLGEFPPSFVFIRQFLTMTLLAYIMVEVGREFVIDLSRKREYAIDYGVAATAATFPWILVVLYFLFFLQPESTSGRPDWIEALVVGRFAAPTSAGVLFSMLAAAGPARTWVYGKTRILAIFDDLDTVLLMIPLQILIVGFAWQLGGVVLAMASLLFLGIKYYRKLGIPHSWPWVLGYSFAMVGVSEGLYLLTKDPASGVGMHIEILLPAFALGAMIRSAPDEHAVVPGEDLPGTGHEEKVGLVISGAFMLLVGMTMPTAFGQSAQIQSTLSAGTLALHVAAVTLLSNIGKMFVCLCYRRVATFRERLAVAIAMFPRGEVGAGVLAVSLTYGIGGDMVTVAFLSLTLNLILTGLFIYAVKRLASEPATTNEQRRAA